MFGRDPNIVGEIFRDNNSSGSQFFADVAVDDLKTTGALGIIQGSNAAIDNGIVFTGAKGITFDASKSSSVYAGTTIQPKSLSVLVCIKL